MWIKQKLHSATCCHTEPIRFSWRPTMSCFHELLKLRPCKCERKLINTHLSRQSFSFSLACSPHFLIFVCVFTTLHSSSFSICLFHFLQAIWQGFSVRVPWHVWFKPPALLYLQSRPLKENDYCLSQFQFQLQGKERLECYKDQMGKCGLMPVTK